MFNTRYPLFLKISVSVGVRWMIGVTEINKGSTYGNHGHKEKQKWNLQRLLHTQREQACELLCTSVFNHGDQESVERAHAFTEVTSLLYSSPPLLKLATRVNILQLILFFSILCFYSDFPDKQFFFLIKEEKICRHSIGRKQLNELIFFFFWINL